MLLSSQIARELNFVDVKGKKITQIKVRVFYEGHKNVMKERPPKNWEILVKFCGLLKKHDFK